MTPRIKAWSATILFSLVALWALFYRAPHGLIVLPQVFFFAVLIINTFFSIRFYSTIQPDDIWQKMIDAVLVGCYLMVALSLGSAVSFAFWALALFTAAPSKYIFMLGAVPHLKLLKKKALLDSLGAASCLFLLGATLIGAPVFGATVFSLTFAIANMYLLILRPMYRL